MIGDSFEFNGKSYTIKRDVSFGEYKKVSRLTNSLQKLATDYKDATPEDKPKLEAQFANTSDEQLQVIGDFLESMLGLTQVSIDDMRLSDAITLFSLAFTESTQVKKKSEITSE